jgi:sugar-specific transcriptional regulator TrmB
MPTKNFIAELEELGLSTPEAQAYTTLLNHGSLGAAAVAQRSGIQRSNVYAVLSSLAEKGLIEAGTGYGSKFNAVLPDEALRLLMVREREKLVQRERLAEELAQRMAPFANASEAAPEELIQVLRNPRAVAERFERLELEAERQIDIFTKPPFFMRPGNPAEEKALRRGVKVRGLYEKAALEDPGVKPYFSKWITAGEEARIYDGELPHKLAIFDAQVVLMPLIRPGEQTKTLLIRHAQLAQSLSLAFQYVWDRAEAIANQKSAKANKTRGVRITDATSHRNDKPVRA